MSNVKEFKDVLIEGWEAWDSGNYELPSKNVTLKDGTKGCIIIGEEGSCVYNKPLDTVNDVDQDMGESFLANSEEKNDTSRLTDYLSDEDIKEVEIVFNQYVEYNKTR